MHRVAPAQRVHEGWVRGAHEAYLPRLRRFVCSGHECLAPDVVEDPAGSSGRSILAPAARACAVKMQNAGRAATAGSVANGEVDAKYSDWVDATTSGSAPDHPEPRHDQCT